MTNPSLQLDAALLLETFDEPLVIPRPYLQLTGSITAALFLNTLASLTHDLGVQSDLPEPDRGWIVLTQRQWQALTGLTRYEQESARRALDQRAFIEQARRGMPARLSIRLRVAAISDALRAQADANYGSLVDAQQPAHSVIS